MAKPQRGNGYASLAKPDPAVHLAHLPCNAVWIAEFPRDVDLAGLSQQLRAGLGEAGVDPDLLQPGKLLP